jgi:hypothetical protein
MLLGALLLLPSVSLAVPVVLFDEAHGQPFHVRGEGPYDLARLGERFAAAGNEVRTSARPLDSVSLEGVTALVISGPFQPLSDAELAALREFIARGGSLAVMLHIAPPAGGLLTALQVDYAHGILHDSARAIDGNPQNFTVGTLGTHPLTAGLTEFAVYGSWALRGTVPEVETLAWSSDHGWVDLDRDRRPGPADAAGAFGVIVAGAIGKGRFVVFGDDALFQNRFLVGSNRQLADNLARWMIAGEVVEPKLQ